MKLLWNMRDSQRQSELENINELQIVLLKIQIKTGIGTSTISRIIRNHEISKQRGQTIKCFEL